MSSDAGSAAAPEDTATREVASERPGLESADPGSADSATSTPDSADRGVAGSARTDGDSDEIDGAAGTDDESDEIGDESGSASDPGDSDAGGSGPGRTAGRDPGDDGFIGSLVRDSTITGLPGETGAPPAEPHAPQAQQEGDEPVGSEPAVGDNPRGVD